MKYPLCRLGNITFCGERDSADVINSGYRDGEIIRDYAGGLDVITRVLTREMKEGISQRRKPRDVGSRE